MSQYDIQNVLKQTESLEISSAFQPYSGVTIVTGEQNDQGEDIVYMAGDDSGRVLTIENPWGTQAQADNILDQIRGFTYQPYSAGRALVDPAAELGDGISVNDVYSGIYEMSKDYTPMLPTDVSAPQSEEIDHEYPFESLEQRNIERRFTSLESEFRINSQEIAAKVSEVGGQGNNVSWSLKSDAWRVFANGSEVFRVDRYGATVTGAINATSGQIGGFAIGSYAISYNGLTWNGTKNGIYLGTSGIQLGNKNGSYFQASSSGAVVAQNMTLTGTLTIGGQSITAAALRGGAQAAYSRSGGWDNTKTAWDNATRSGTSSYPATFKCGALTATSGLSISGFFTWGNYTIGRTTIRDYNNVQRNVLSWQ